MNLNFEYGDSKTAVANINNDGKIHRAVMTDDYKYVIIYEYQQKSYPKWGIFALSLKDYLEIIDEIEWIRNSLSNEEVEFLKSIESPEVGNND